MRQNISNQGRFFIITELQSGFNRIFHNLARVRQNALRMCEVFRLHYHTFDGISSLFFPPVLCYPEQTETQAEVQR